MIAVDAYCRDIEAYLCRKNDGHLVRIVGPEFDQVSGWATRGIPLKVVFRGVDRHVDRYYAKGPRRRPVRIGFCEADVLDVFDEWRRAVGVSGGEEEPPRHRESLATHLERVVARLTALRAGASRLLDDTLDATVRELDAQRARAENLRGAGREGLLQRLREMDGRLIDAARAAIDPPTLERLAAEADVELAPFRPRMPADVHARSRQACVDRLIREHVKLPTIAFD